MKKFIKVLSVVLCVLTVLSSAGILGFAADEAAAEPQTVSDGTEGNENPPSEDTENTDGTEQTEDETQTDQTYTPDTAKKKHKTYAENVANAFSISVRLLGGVVMAPAAITGLSVAFLPVIVTLPVTLPIAAVGGAGASALGAIGILLSPVIGLIGYICQFFIK